MPHITRSLPALWLSCVGLALAACSPTRAVEAWRLLGDLAAGPAPSALKEVTPEPRRRALAYRIDGRERTGDLYRPGDRAKAALVLVPGAAPEGKDDPRLVAFAMTLARARFAVLVPEIENLRDLNVDPADARVIADAVRHLAALSGTGVPPAVGLIAISYAAGPAVLAALQEDARDHVRFVMAIGGYYDIEAVVTFFTTGYFRDGAEISWRHRAPNAYGKWVFVRSNARRLEDARDRVLLSAMAARKLRDLTAEIGDLAAKLGAEGRAVYALLVNADPEAVPALIARLPAAVRADMAALDLKRRDLSKLAARLILVHGREDAIIPYSESKALAGTLPDSRVTLYLVDNLAHVDLSPGGMIDALRLWQAAYRLLAERDAGSG
ncbi:MAG: hypothetical protein ACE5KF_00065 [Kiloniellaceae bacterium]